MFGRKKGQLKEGDYVFTSRPDGEYTNMIFGSVTGIDGDKIGVNGFLVPVRDVKALIVAMLRFIENPDFIESMGQQSRRMAEERFDVRRINAKLLEVLGLSSLD